MAGLIKRGKIYYAMYYIGNSKHRVSLKTDSKQIAKDKIRQIESKLAQGQNNPFPTKTSLADIVNAFVEHIRTYKTGKSVSKEVYYLRQIFGIICPALKIVSSKTGKEAKKTSPKKNGDKRYKDKIIQATYIEDITTSDISHFISHKVKSRNLAPRTANRYREILSRFFNWGMKEYGVKMPNDKNPVSEVPKYKEKAPQIRFLTLPQIDEQLISLKDYPQLQTMAALYIYAGLRREEALWLTLDDIDLKPGAYGIIRVQAKTVNGQYWQPKTKVNRAVPISSTPRYYLDHYSLKPSNGRWYFPSPKGCWYDCNNFSKDLRVANKAANLKWACLEYRHTFGSQLAMKGESLYKISSLMGNSPEICRRHYAALLPESLTNCVEFGQPVPTQIKIVS